jgi:hypothetical protein
LRGGGAHSVRREGQATLTVPLVPLCDVSGGLVLVSFPIKTSTRFFPELIEFHKVPKT